MLLESFLRFCEKEQLLCHEAPVLIGISGGLDSVVLAHLYHEAGLPFGLAHVNFGLRAEESDGDEQFVKDLAQQWNVPLELLHCHAGKIAREEKISIQMAARQIRYDWFEQIRLQKGYEAIAVAHHADDLAETVLLHLIKGSGIRGLRGFMPRNKHIIRPLMFAYREEVLHYAKEKGIKWREDSSNQSLYYERNRIRHKVIPALNAVRQDAVKGIIKSASLLAEAEPFLMEQLDTYRKAWLSEEEDELLIRLDALKSHDQAGFMLYEWLKDYHFTESDVMEILAETNQKSGRRFLSNTHEAILERSSLLIRTRNNQGQRRQNLRLDLADHEGEIENTGFKLVYKWVSPLEADYRNAKKNEAYLDAERLGSELLIRPPKQGDTFVPLGMLGKKLISDFMIDQKFGLKLKEKALLLCSGDQIAWLIGHRQDDRFKVRPETKRVLHLRFEEL